MFDGRFFLCLYGILEFCRVVACLVAILDREKQKSNKNLIFR